MEVTLRGDFEAYLAEWVVDGEPWSMQRLLECENEANMERIVVMPNTQVDPDNAKLADVIESLPDEQQQKLLPCALINPHKGDSSLQELKHLVNDRGFKGLKLMAAVQDYNVDDEPLVRPLVEAARELDVVVSVHSGPGGCHPERIGNLAGWIPTTPVVMDHMGFPDDFPEAVCQAKAHPNLFLGTTILRFHDRWGDDPDTVIPSEVQSAFDELGAERIVFGSNLPEYRPVQVINALERLNLNNSQKELLFGENLRRIYKL